MTPQLLIVGHLVKDIHPDGWRAGGGALYAAAQAVRLGVDTAVVTACDADIEPERLIPGASWHVIALEACTQFENTYAKGRRTQRVRPSDRVLAYEDIPPAWHQTPTVLLTPVFHDVDEALPAQLVNEGIVVGIGPQGWLRGEEDGAVVPGGFAAASSWLAGDAIFVSEEDVPEADAVEQWQTRVPVVVLTRGEAGQTVWDADGRHDLAPVTAREEDPTGAGDVFATAFLVRYGETKDVLGSARFAAAAAAVSVEGTGTDAVGDREQIEARLNASGVTRR